MDDETQGTSGSLASTGQLVPLGLAPRSDLTYKTIEGLNLAHSSIHRSLLTGSILRSCTFTSVDFSRCDMDGMLVEGCVFIDCEISSTDIRSSSFSDTTFKNCDLSTAYIHDSSFSNVRFDESSLQGSIVTECSFTSCWLHAISLSRGSFLQNCFRSSRFTRMVLGDCSFQYSILSDCAFEESKIAAESVGMTYGLTREDIRRLQLVYLGQDEEVPSSVDPVPPLVEAYQRRRWHLGVMLISMSFGLSSTAYAIREYLQTVQGRASTGVAFKRDDLLFFVTVLEELAREEALPLMSCVDVIETVSRLATDIEASPRPDNAHLASTLHLVSSKTMLVMESMIERFEARRLQLDSNADDESERVVFVFQEKPEIPVAALLNQIGPVSGFPVRHESQTLVTRVGSYEELVSTTLFTMLSFQVFLYLVNGCIVQLDEMKRTLSGLTHTSSLSRHARSPLQPRQSLANFLLVPMRKLLAYALSMPWFKDAKLNGFSKANLLEARREGRVQQSPPREDEK